jgi:hypothetical protein
MADNNLLERLRLSQVGVESTKGTAVAATYQMSHPVIVQPEAPIEKPPAQRGIAMRNPAQPAQIFGGSSVQWPAHPITFEDTLYIFAAALQGGVTPTQPDAVNDPLVYLWSHFRRRADIPNPEALTLEIRDQGVASTLDDQFTFMFVTDFTINFDNSSLVSLSANGFAQSRETGAWTFTDLSATFPIDVEPTGGVRGAIFLDDLWANLGTTQIVGEILSGSLVFNSGLAPLRTIDGSAALDWSNRRFDAGQAGFTLDITAIAQDGAADFYQTERGKAEALTPRAIRLEWQGSVMPGTTGFTKLLQLDLYGLHDVGSYSISGAFEGQQTVTMRLQEVVQENATDPWIQTRLRNLLSAY